MRCWTDLTLQLALAAACGIGNSQPPATRLSMGYAAGFLLTTMAGQARPRKTGAENSWRVDVTPTFHPAATRDRPVLSRMSTGEATGGFKPARCFSSSAANASACPARCNATRCRYRQTRQAPRSTSVPCPLRQALDRIVADDHLQAPALGDQIAQLADQRGIDDGCSRSRRESPAMNPVRSRKRRSLRSPSDASDAGIAKQSGC